MERAEVGHNIRTVRKTAKVERKVVASVLGTDVSYITKIERGTANVTLDKILKIADFLKVPAYSLFSKDPLVKKPEAEKEPVIVEIFPDQDTKDLFHKTKTRDEFIPIRIVGTASLGQGRIIESEEILGFALICKHVLPKGAGPRKLKESPKVVCLHAEGDSMAPTIQNKSLVAIDLEDRTEIKRNMIYAVDIPDSGISLKRVIKTNEQLMLFADNPNEPGFPTCLSLAGLRYNPVCGRVVWAWNKF